MSIFRSRALAIGAGATILALVGSTGAVAAGLVGSKDIKNNSVRSVDIKNGDVRMKDLRPGVAKKIKTGARGPQGEQGPQGPGGLYQLEHATLAAETTIANIGGPINENNTDLDTSLTLPAGTYFVTVQGAFERNAAASDPALDVFPQLSLWIDRNHDGAFQWQADEGDISPNALMPDVVDRHISVSGQSVITLSEETQVGLLGFGYDAESGSTGSGQIDVTEAQLTATPMP